MESMVEQRHAKLSFIWHLRILNVTSQQTFIGVSRVLNLK